MGLVGLAAVAECCHAIHRVLPHRVSTITSLVLTAEEADAYGVLIVSSSMIVYSVTIIIETSIETDWVEWMQREHIPEVLATGFFIGHRFLRLLDPVSEAGYATYNVQYLCRSLETYAAYRRQDAVRLQEKHARRYSGKFESFRTVLEQIP